MIRDNRLPHATSRLGLGKEAVHLAGQLKSEDDIPSGELFRKIGQCKRKTKRRKTVASDLHATSASGECRYKAIREQQQISQVNDMLGSHVIVLSVISEFSCLY